MWCSRSVGWDGSVCLELLRTSFEAVTTINLKHADAPTDSSSDP